MPFKATRTSPQFEGNFRNSPLEQVRTLFAGFVQGLFQAAPNGAYHWDPDLDSTEILVCDESPVQVTNIGQRPAISMTRGPVQFYSLGLDDMLSYNNQTGVKQKSVLVPGTMSINCISRVPLEADRIAWIVAEQLWANRELLMAAGFFEIGRQPVIGSPSPAGSLVQGDMGDEYVATTVSCPYQFYRTSAITPLGQQILGSFDVTLHARAQRTEALGASYSLDANPAAGIHNTRPPHFSPASDAAGNTPAPGEEAPSLPLVPHPLNPAQLVIVRAARPNRAGLQAPSMRGRSIPLQYSRVTESSVYDAGTSRAKVD